jgi:phosphotriesterase-related protein
MIPRIISNVLATGRWVLLLLFFIQALFSLSSPALGQETIPTVNGTIQIERLGLTLTHEHIMSNFGKDQNETSEYNEDVLFKQVVPYLKKLKSLGVNSIFDCTTAYFGRRVDLLKKIGDSTGIQLITNTGFYGAANDRYIPPFAFDANATEISKIWVEEFRKGIDGTNIRPGFIKLAFDEGPPSEIDTKLFVAGILTHLKTGLTLAVHTGDNPEAVDQQLRLLRKYKVSPRAWVWVHAHKVTDVDRLLKTAAQRAWISLDGANTSNVGKFVDIIKRFKSRNLLHRILLSHDGNGFPRGGEIRQFETIPKELIPALLAHGFTEKEIDQIMVQNPKNAFRIAVKKVD